MSDQSTDPAAARAAEAPDDERGAHNRIGYFNTDEEAAHDEAGVEQEAERTDVERTD